MRICPLIMLSVSVFALTAAGCGKKKDKGVSANLPMVVPPVRAAAPKAFQAGATLRLTDATASVGDFKTRFFTTGPTNVFTILKAIDARVTGINQQTLSITPAPTCLTQTPVSYTITPWDQSVTMFAQCYEQGLATATNPALVQWGVKDGVTYIYSAADAEHVAAILTPVGTAGDYAVHAWIGLGYQSSPWDSGGYGVMEIKGDSTKSAFEFTVAGLGFGYCGAQMKSDGTNIYAMLSADMGTCLDTSTLCVSASDASTAATCTSAVQSFSLAPIGRDTATGSGSQAGISKWSASKYPSSGLIELDGKDSDALHFGPSTPTTGASSLPTASAQ